VLVALLKGRRSALKTRFFKVEVPLDAAPNPLADAPFIS